MKALKLNFDPLTGIRAGNVNPRDPNLHCGQGWQNLQSRQEIRLILNEDLIDLAALENTDGVDILDGDEAIAQAVAALGVNLISYKISNAAIMQESLKSALRRDDAFLDDLAQEASDQEELEYLYNKGVKGISVRTKEQQVPTDVLKNKDRSARVI